jgi:hypothetical protein
MRGQVSCKLRTSLFDKLKINSNMPEAYKQLKYNSGVIQYLTISGLLTPFIHRPKEHGNLQWKLTMQIGNREKKSELD